MLIPELAARELFVSYQHTGRTTWCMTLAAMAQVANEIRAPVPLLVSLRVRLETGRFEIERFPAARCKSRVHVPGKVMLRTLVRYGLEAHQVGPDCQQVLPTDACVGRIGK